MSLHYHIYLFTSRDDCFQNLGETTVLACPGFLFRLWPVVQKRRLLKLSDREFKKLQRQLRLKRRIRLKLGVMLDVLRLFHADHVVQERRSILSLAWHE